MTPHDYALYGSFSPSPGLPSPDPFNDHDHDLNHDLTSPLVTPATTNGHYSSANDVVASAWERYEAGKRVDAERDSLIEVGVASCHLKHLLCEWRGSQTRGRIG